MMRKLILAASVVLATFGAAHAHDRTSLHPIEWYHQHPAEREATLDLCRSDTRYSHNTDCLNAHAAETQAWSDRLDQRVQSDTASSLYSPRYWATNRLARIGVLASCSHPPTIYDPNTCAAARAGDAIDPRGHN